MLSYKSETYQSGAKYLCTNMIELSMLGGDVGCHTITVATCFDYSWCKTFLVKSCVCVDRNSTSFASRWYTLTWKSLTLIPTFDSICGWQSSFVCYPHSTVKRVWYTTYVYPVCLLYIDYQDRHLMATWCTDISCVDRCMFVTSKMIT